jgi:RecJ-like exonuclease
MSEAPLTPEPGTWPCPRCHGVGDMADGAVTFTGLGFQATALDCRKPTPCPLCGGNGRVRVLRVPDEVAAP